MTIEECKSYSEMGRLLGYSYYNGSVKKAVIKFCKLNNLYPEEIIKKNSKKPNKCLYCGKELDGKFKYTKKFCNSSCAASFNNKGRAHSEETKFKIKNSLHKKYDEGILTPHNLGKYKDNNFFINKTKEKNIKTDDKRFSKIRKCVICGKDFTVLKRANGSYSRTTTCSDECHHKLTSNRSKEIMNKLISEGKHIGWQSRNIISYPEQFWMKVLENNNIDYKHNFFIKKHHYFLDFFININNKKIDLEIDGKQHKYENRLYHDIERDKNLKKDGYIIYRVEWNSINTEDGSEKMRNKISDFIKFIDECKNN